VAGAVALLAVLLIVGFFVVDWVDFNAEDANEAQSEAVDEADTFIAELSDVTGNTEDAIRDSYQNDEFVDVGGECDSFTAFELWIGAECGDGEYAILDLDPELDEQPEGFADVALPERLLILVPLLAIGLLAAALLFGMRMMNDQTLLLVMVILSLILLLCPFLWQTVRTLEWREDFRTGVEDVPPFDELTDDALDEYVELLVAPLATLFATTWAVVVSLLALLVSLGGLGYLYIDRRRPEQAPGGPA
jgi:hypothetical protein